MVEGDPVPDVAVTMPDGVSTSLRDRATPCIIYFYPRDDTSGCTREAGDFSALMPAFADAGVAVIGISRDDQASHARFSAKHALSVPLATDPDGSVCAAFGVWVEKNMYGRKSMGIERATFLFGADGRLVRAWRKVRVPGHADAVIEAVSARRDGAA